jgi:hypothetical protein
MTGQCKYCRKRNVQISQFDRFPDNVFIRNKYGDAQGICYDCELLIPSSKKELLEALSYLKEDVHMYIVMRELLNILPDEGVFNHKAIYEETTPSQIKISFEKNIYHTEKTNFDSLKSLLGGIVVAAARMGQENTPKERKQAARSIFLRGLIRYGMASGNQEKLKKEYGKWFNKIF